jgi:hypothetical protein
MSNQILSFQSHGSSQFIKQQTGQVYIHPYSTDASEQRMKATYIMLNVAIPSLSHSQNTQRRSEECAYPFETFSSHHITQDLT